MLVSRVEFGSTNDQNLHSADRAMLYSGRNQDRFQGLDGVPDAVQLDLCSRFAFQNHVNLRVLAVVVWAGVRRDFRQVQRAGKSRMIGKGTSGLATRASDRR